MKKICLFITTLLTIPNQLYANNQNSHMEIFNKLSKDMFEQVDFACNSPEWISLEVRSLETLNNLATQPKAIINSVVNYYTAAGYSLLYDAICANSATIAEKLIALGTNINAIVIGTGGTPLHFAIVNPRATFIYIGNNHERENNLAIIELLIKHGANPNIPDKYGLMPLHYALAVERYDIVKLLLSYGAEPNIDNIGEETILHFAARNGRTDIAELFINAGAKIDQANNFGNTPLHAAAQTGNVPIAELLLDAGAQINVTNIASQTPLCAAVSNNQEKTVELLLKMGAHTNNWVLHEAAFNGNTNIAQRLINAGADVNQFDAYGFTPIHYAA